MTNRLFLYTDAAASVYKNKLNAFNRPNAERRLPLTTWGGLCPEVDWDEKTMTIYRYSTIQLDTRNSC